MQATDYFELHPERRGNVYVMTSGDDPYGPVKIGWALDPWQRLTTLQTGTPHELRLYTYLPASQHVERSIHRSLADERVRGEWFGGERTAETVAVMARASAACRVYNATYGRLPRDIEILTGMAIVGADRIIYTPPENPRFPQLAQYPVVEPEPEPEPEYIVVGESAGGGMSSAGARGRSHHGRSVNRRARH